MGGPARHGRIPRRPGVADLLDRRISIEEGTGTCYTEGNKLCLPSCPECMIVVSLNTGSET